MIWNFGRIDAEKANEYLKYVAERSDEIAIKIKKNNIAVSTTIWLMETLAQQKFDLESLIKEVNLEYANPGLIEGSRLGRGWLPGNNSYEESSEVINNSVNRRKSEIFWETYFEAMHIMTKSLIENTSSIELVFSGEYWITENTINQILDSIAKTNDENRNIDICEYLN